eukprot:485223-Pelagomonas_calceolata.AAC.2
MCSHLALACTKGFRPMLGTSSVTRLKGDDSVQPFLFQGTAASLARTTHAPELVHRLSGWPQSRTVSGLRIVSVIGKDALCLKRRA